MDDTVIISILAMAGVISVLLFALKGLLDQFPDLIDSASRTRDAWRRFRNSDAASSGQTPRRPSRREDSGAAQQAEEDSAHEP
ncbi:hypothetical protein [Streptomyces niveiscabiei]|uniref:Secreted protein n=1 Tax=Streptomyces niveiscabiei TaxID=164115 RepID=A0ABW9HZ93_9ACTN